MKLYLLRHAEAAEREDARYKSDAVRPLTAKGQQRAKQLAHALRQMHVTFDVMLSSPLVRARETAEILEHGMRLAGRLELTPHLAPDGDPGELLGQIHQVRPVPESVILVGHEPYLSQLISLLCTGGGELGLTLKKCALCRLEVETLRLDRCATLEWLVTSRWAGHKRTKEGGHTKQRAVAK